MGSGVLQGAPKDAPDIVRVPDRQREMKVSHLGATSREGCLRTLGVCLAEKLSHGGLSCPLLPGGPRESCSWQVSGAELRSGYGAPVR